MRVVITILLLLGWAAESRSAWQDDISFRGYLRQTPVLWRTSRLNGDDQDYQFTNLLHTRQNMRWYAANSIQLGLEIKTRLFLGEGSRELLTSTDEITARATYFDWGHVFVDEPRAALDSRIDRGWLTLTAGALEMTVGRQRIAWGTNLVFNPIDLFNPSSPLDFDNEEMPGTDAVRVQWFTGPGSRIELAVAPQRNADAAIGAVQLRQNLWGYDWLLLAGRRCEEAVFGGAWAGSLFEGGFRGELLMAHPRSSAEQTRPYLTGAVSGDYTFPNSFYIHAVLLYNERGTTGNAGGERLLERLERGELTSSRINLYGEIAHDLSALVRADLAGIFNPYDHSWYLGPSLVWSLATDLDLTAIGLFFGGSPGTEFGDTGNILMLRLKFSY